MDSIVVNATIAQLKQALLDLPPIAPLEESASELTPEEARQRLALLAVQEKSADELCIGIEGALNVASRRMYAIRSQVTRMEGIIARAEEAAEVVAWIRENPAARIAMLLREPKALTKDEIALLSERGIIHTNYRGKLAYNERLRSLWCQALQTP